MVEALDSTDKFVSPYLVGEREPVHDGSVNLPVKQVIALSVVLLALRIDCVRSVGDIFRFLEYGVGELLPLLGTDLGLQEFPCGFPDFVHCAGQFVHDPLHFTEPLFVHEVLRQRRSIETSMIMTRKNETIAVRQSVNKFMLDSLSIEEIGENIHCEQRGAGKGSDLCLDKVFHTKFHTPLLTYDFSF